MTDKTPMEIYYKLYSEAVWNGKQDQQNTYKKLWIESLQKNIPVSTLRKKYQATIYRITANRILNTKNMENLLLKKRFSFSTEIKGKKYTYRELLAGLKEKDSTIKTTVEIRQALLNETAKLMENGFCDLINKRNTHARETGFENYWTMKNSNEDNTIRSFLINLDRKLINTTENISPPHLPEKEKINMEDAVLFYCRILFAKTKIPKFTVIIRKGRDCPPGPPFVQPLEYRPKRGHILGLNLPFVQSNQLKQENLGSLFHELTHLFHFSFIGSRGSYTFPIELAKNTLLYESEALRYQNLVLSAWNGGFFAPDWNMLKDLVYLGETERQLYSLKKINKKSILELILRRIEEHYPKGDFMRTPIGSSHLINEEYAAQYWIYSAANWISFQKIRETLKNRKPLSIPAYWAEGNAASYRIKLNTVLRSKDINNFSYKKDLVKPQDLHKKSRKEILRELKETGLLA